MKKLFLISLILCITIFLSGQEKEMLKASEISELSLDELLSVEVSVSTTLPTNVFETPSSVTVIDRTMIDQYNFLSVAEAVRQVGGVEVLQTVIDKNVPTVRGILQNFYANKVLIMINNVPVWNPTYGNSTLDRISINDVERIEVLKGPASVLYGTNAYSGVINIVLRSAGDQEINATLTGGIPDIGSAAVRYGENKGDLSWNVSGSSSVELRTPYQVNGANDPDASLIKGGESLYQDDTLYYYGEEIRKRTFNFDIAFKSHSFYINNFVNSYTTPGVNASYKTGANRSVTDKGTLVSYKFDHDISEKTNFVFSTYFDYHYRNQLMSQAISQAARFSSYRVTSFAKVNHRFNDFVGVELGGEIFKGVNMGHDIINVMVDTVLNENIKNKDGISEGSVFSQVDFTYKKFSLLTGLRYTANPGFGGDISPRITAAFNINKSNIVKVIYGESFRTPNFLELYFDHWSVNGNPDLMPEKSSSVELVYSAIYNKIYGQVSGYMSEYSNLIKRETDTINPNVNSVYVNEGSFASFGVEAELRYQNPKLFNSYASYNYCMADKKGIESEFKYVPMHTVSFGINKPIKKFYISANAYTYSGTEGHIEKIPYQYTVDAVVGYKHKSLRGVLLNHSLTLKNLNNSDMLIPEYIRARPGVNHIATTGFGRRVMYTLKVNF